MGGPRGPTGNRPHRLRAHQPGPPGSCVVSVHVGQRAGHPARHLVHRHGRLRAGRGLRPASRLRGLTGLRSPTDPVHLTAGAVGARGVREHPHGRSGGRSHPDTKWRKHVASAYAELGRERTRAFDGVARTGGLVLQPEERVFLPHRRVHPDRGAGGDGERASVTPRGCSIRRVAVANSGTTSAPPEHSVSSRRSSQHGSGRRPRCSRVPHRRHPRPGIPVRRPRQLPPRPRQLVAHRP